MILFALLAFVLVGFVALSIDTGFLMAERRQAQNAADAAALAAASSALMNMTSAQIEAAGKEYAIANAGVDADDVVVRRASTGPYAGNDNYIEVIVTKTVDKFFVGAVYSGAWEVTARAVAGIEPEPRPYALLALDAPGIYINGNTELYVNGGSAMSNSNILGNGGANLFFADGSIDANGTISGNGNWYAGDGMHPDSPVVPDPLEDATPPTVTGNPEVPDCSDNCVFLPGNYHDLGSITIKKRATFLKGIYVFSGNTSLNLQNTNSKIVGDGVLLYFMDQARFDPKNGDIHLTAPCLPTTPAIASCSGEAAYAGGVDGMVLWIASCKTFDSQGNGLFEVEGIIYAPCSHVELHGNPAGVGVQVIVKNLVVKGTSDFVINYREYVEIERPKIWLVE